MPIYSQKFEMGEKSEGQSSATPLLFFKVKNSRITDSQKEKMLLSSHTSL